jgi:O-antigen/teichoic acid export membrane protein
VASQLIALAVVPFSAQILGSSKFGEFNLANSLFVYASMFASFGFGLYLAREIPRRDSISAIVNFSITAKILISVVFAGILIVVAEKIGASDQFVVLGIVFAAVLLMSSVDLRWVFIGKDLMWRISILNLVGQIASAVLIFSILRNSSQVILFAMCQNLSLLFPALVSVWLYWKTYGPIQFTLHYDNWPELRKESLHFGLISILATVNVQIGTIWLAILLSTSEVGVYSAGFKLMMFFNMVFNLSSTVVMPSISRLFVVQKEKLMSLLNAYFTLSLIFGIGSALLMYFVAVPVVRILFGETYARAAGLMQIWAIGMLPFTPLSIFSTSALMATNGAKQTFKVILTGSIVLLSVLPFSIRYYGISGVAIGQSMMEIIVASTSFVYLARTLQLNRAQIFGMINVKNAVGNGIDILRSRFKNE